jgi:LacI family transcriptional regulator
VTVNGFVRPTMSDVAAEAGVSLKTVSRVVNSEQGVSPPTALRVQAAIERLGFRRNDSARALRRGQRFRMLGLVIEDLGNPFYSAIARGVEEATRERGQLVITGSSDEDPRRERELALLFCERRVDGLLIVPAGDDHRYLEPELRLGMHAVFIDRPPGQIEADAVLIDNAAGARAAAEHLRAHGHERLGAIVDDPAIFTARERCRGFCAAAPDAIVRTGAHDAETAERVAGELLALPEPPTGIFCGNNRITIGVLRALAAGGARAELVGFDDLELADLLSLRVSAVAYDPADLGRKATELLADRVDGDTGPPRHVILPTRLVAR